MCIRDSFKKVKLSEDVKERMRQSSSAMSHSQMEEEDADPEFRKDLRSTVKPTEADVTVLHINYGQAHYYGLRAGQVDSDAVLGRA